MCYIAVKCDCIVIVKIKYVTDKNILDPLFITKNVWCENFTLA